MPNLIATWLGTVPYGPTFERQQRLAARRAAGEIEDQLLLLEHEHVYTLGRRATEAEILMDEGARVTHGIAVEHTDRGGRVTYHGPGQLVGYPIVDIGLNGDMVAYVRRLERAMIATCSAYGVEATTIEGLTGVWVGNDKIGAIGVHVSRGITTHGFALNVDPDLGLFNGIIPCGIVDKGVTSLRRLTGTTATVEQVALTAARALAAELDRELLVVRETADV